MFVVLDNVQYTKRDWRNRNKIITPQGVKWLTIPVETKGRFEQKIYETCVSDPNWVKKHWSLIYQSYHRAPFFDLYGEQFKALYASLEGERSLSRINLAFIELINQILGIKTKIKWFSEFKTSSAPSQRLLDICIQVGATRYYSGPSAASYIDSDLFESKGVQIKYLDFSKYPNYPQQFGQSDVAVSVLDLIFNLGAGARDYLGISET